MLQRAQRGIPVTELDGESIYAAPPRIREEANLGYGGRQVDKDPPDFVPPTAPKAEPWSSPGPSHPDAPAPNPEPRPPRQPAPWFRATTASSVGIEIAVSVCMCTLLGRWIEQEYTHWSPWTMLIGFAIGCGAAVRSVQRALAQYQKELAHPSADPNPNLLMPGATGWVARWAQDKMDAENKVGPGEANPTNVSKPSSKLDE